MIHHGKILKDGTTLQDSGVKNGEMVHVVRKKVPGPPRPVPTYTDAEIQQLNAALRTLGCTPNAPGWTRAMQVGMKKYILFYYYAPQHGIDNPTLLSVLCSALFLAIEK